MKLTTVVARVDRVEDGYIIHRYVGRLRTHAAKAEGIKQDDLAATVEYVRTKPDVEWAVAAPN